MNNVDYRLSVLPEKADNFGNEPGAGCGCCPGGGNDEGFDDMLEERVRGLEIGLARVETVLHSLAAKSDVVAVKLDVAEVKAELASAESGLIKWIIGSAFAAAAIMMAFLNYTKPATGPIITTPSQIGYSVPRTKSSPEE